MGQIKNIKLHIVTDIKNNVLNMPHYQDGDYEPEQNNVLNMPHYQDGDYEPDQVREKNDRNDGQREEFSRDTSKPNNGQGQTVVEEGLIQSTWDTIVDNFDDMNLRENLLRGIFAYGFEKPSAIQQRAIMPAIKGYDLIAQAQSGTGKTATFSIAILQQIDFSLDSCQALVLAPTRELAQQIQKVVLALGDYQKVKCHACIGGTAVRQDLATLQEGVNVVVGTPGRVFDMINRGALGTNHMKMFVLDEADEMFYEGSHQYSCEKRRIDLRRYQAILHQCGKRRVEIGNSDRSLRNDDHYTSCNLP